MRILGTGGYLPRRIVSAEELDSRFGREPGTSFARSGVATRHWVDETETSSAMAAAALAQALDAAGLQVDDLDAVVVSAVAPEQPMPTTSVLTLAALGATGGRCDAFDINASCVGFLTGLRLAEGAIALGRAERVAVVATEIASKGLDHSNTETSSLFGDGAAAVVVGRAGEGESSAVLAARSAVWPVAARACRIDGGGTRWNAMTPPPDPASYLFQMDGAALLRHVARHAPGFVRELLAQAGVSASDVDVVVPHQASGVGLRFLRSMAGVPDGVVDILADHGNQISASLPTALHHAVTTGALQRGQLALLLGTGAGLTVAGTVLRY